MEIYVDDQIVNDNNNKQIAIVTVATFFVEFKNASDQQTFLVKITSEQRKAQIKCLE